MTSEPVRRKLMIAGGGTGGHIFPAVAVAEEFLGRSPGHEVLFINAGRPMDRRILGARRLDFVTISVSGMNRVGFLQKIRGLLRLPLALYQARRAVRDFAPHVLFSVGGYSAAPAALAAKLAGIPVILHEQNSVAGLTTRILARFADEAHVSFAGTELSIDRKKYFVSGNPVRRELFSCRKNKREKSRPMRLLVLGGSQGAHAVNVAVCKCLTFIKSLQVHLVHQTGAADLEMVQEAYRENGIEAEILPFIEDMKTAYAMADLVLCRAGATTIAELASAGLGAILVPFPAATNNHQFYNAKTLSDAGAGVIVEERALDPETLAALVKNFAENPGETDRMAENALALARENAAQTITDAIMNHMPGQ